MTSAQPVNLSLHLRQHIQKTSLLDITRLVLAGFVLICGIKLFSFTINIIRTPYPLELREGAILSTTQLLLHGQNPFGAENLPQYMNGYGIFYNLLATPVAALFGNTFPVHRLLTMTFILAGLAFLIFAIIRKGGSRLFAVILGLCVLANELYSVTPLTRPDGLGFLLFILAALLPWLRGFSRTSLAISAILATLAFYTKLYFYLPVFFLALYLFLFVSKRKALEFFILCAGLLVISAILVTLLFPFYFYTTLFMATYQTVYVFAHMVRQVRQFILLYSGILAILLFIPDWQRLGEFHLPHLSLQRLRERLNFRSLNRPFISTRMDYPTFALAAVTLSVILKFGGHDGSKMAYLFQMMSPLLAVVFSRLLTQMARYTLLSYVLVAITLGQNLLLIGLNPLKAQFLPNALPNNPALYQTGWDQARKLVRNHHHILNDPLTAGLLVEENLPLVDNGHTEYFQASNIPNLPILPNPEKITQVDQVFRKSLLQNVRGRCYDLVILNTKSSPFIGREMLARYYHLDGDFDLYAMQNRETFKMEIWSPKISSH